MSNDKSPLPTGPLAPSAPSSESPPAGTSERRAFDLAERTAKFGEEIIRFCRTLTKDVVTEPLIRQMVKSGTSVGANYCEADDAISGREFRQKIGTCKKESRETRYWLRMIAAAD